MNQAPSWSEQKTPERSSTEEPGLLNQANVPSAANGVVWNSELLASIKATCVPDPTVGFFNFHSSAEMLQLRQFGENIVGWYS